MRTLIALLLLSGAAFARQEVTIQFDRVHLRNGNFLDGKVAKEAEQALLLKVKGGELIIKKETIQPVRDKEGRLLGWYEKMNIVVVQPLPETTPETTPATGPDTTPVKPENGKSTPVNPDRRDPFTPAVEVQGLKHTIQIKPETVSKIKDILGRLRKANTDDQWKIMEEFKEAGEGTAEYLADVMDQLDNEMLQWASTAIGQIGDAAAAPILRDKLGSKRVDVRSVAVMTLAVLKDASALGTLRGLAGGDPSSAVRGAAIDALGTLGEEDMLGALAGLMSDEIEDLRYRASRAFTIIVQREKLQVEAASVIQDAMRVARAEALPVYVELIGNMKFTDAIPDVMDLLAASDPKVRAAAVTALGRLEAKAAAEELIEMTKTEPEEWILIQLCNAHQRIRDKRAVAALIDLLQRDSLQLRTACSRTLQALTGQNHGTDPEKWIEWYKTVTREPDEDQ